MVHLINKEARVFEYPQGTEEWLDFRIKKFTSTLVGMITQGATASSIKQYYGENDFTGNIHTRRGNMVESELRSYYEMDLPYRLETPTVYEGNLLASLDGITPGGETIYEFKSTKDIEKDFFKDGSIELKHIHQIQFAMGISGATSCIYVMALWDEITETIDYENVRQKTVFFDPKIYAEILENIHNFEIQLQNMEVNELETRKNDNHMELASQYIELKSQEKEIKDNLKNIGDRIKEYGIHQEHGISVIERKGSTRIDYKNICELLMEFINDYDGKIVDDIRQEYSNLLADNKKESEPTLAITISKGK